MGVYRVKGSPYWYISYWYEDENGKHRIRETTRTTLFEEAVSELQHRQWAARNGLYQPATERKLNRTFTEFAEEYRRDAEVRKRGWKIREQYILNRLLGKFGSRRLIDIRPVDIASYIQELADQKRKPATLNRHLQVIKHMASRAVGLGYLKKNPASEIPLYKVHNWRQRILSLEEERNLLLECQNFSAHGMHQARHLHTFVCIALHTGMRAGEIMALRWTDVDFSQRTVRVFASKTQTERVIPVNDRLATILRTTKKRANGAYVIADEFGNPMHSVRRAFQSARERAGLLDVRIHDLRHTFASRLIDRGVPDRIVQKLLGHSTPGMTVRYTHPSEDALRRAVASLERSPRILTRDLGARRRALSGNEASSQLRNRLAVAAASPS